MISVFFKNCLRWMVLLALLMPRLVGAVTCDVNGDNSLLPNVGDLADLLVKVAAGNTTGSCSNLGCDFDGNGGAAPTQADYDALTQIILTEDQGGQCVPGIALKGTLEKPEDLPARTASRTLDPSLSRVGAYNLITGEKLSLRDAQVDGFGGFTVKVPVSTNARDILLVASDGANQLRTIVEDVTGSDTAAGKIDYGSTLAAAVYADGVSQSQNPSMSTIKTQLVQGNYILDGVPFEGSPSDGYISKVVSCLGGSTCTVDNSQPKLALRMLENNYIATYFFSFAFNLYKDFGTTARMASLFGSNRTSSAAITCELGETKVTDNICFSLDTGLTIQDQPVPNMSCLLNGKIAWTQTQESVNGTSKTFQWMKGPLTVSGCADKDVLEDGVIDVDVKVFWGPKKTGQNQFYMSLQHVRNSSIKYRSTESSLKAAVYVPQGDGDVCIPLGLTCPTTQTATMAGNFTVTFKNKQADLTSDGTFSYPASNGNLAVGTLIGVTRDGSAVNIPYKITEAEQLELNGSGTISLAGGDGTLTYDTTAGNFKFNATTGGFVRFTGPQSSYGQATYNLDGTGSANLVQTGTNIGQLSWTSLTEQASLYFPNTTNFPRANIFVIAK